MISSSVQIDLFLLRQRSIDMRTRSILRIGAFPSNIPPPWERYRVVPANEAAPAEPVRDPSTSPETRTGEAPTLKLVETSAKVSAQFSQAQCLALLLARGSDLAKAVAQGMKTKGVAADRYDFRVLVSINLAVNRGNFHTLTYQGRWKADQIAKELAGDYGIKLVTRVLRQRGMYEPGRKATFNFW